MAGYKIALADEHLMFLEGVKAFLSNSAEMQLEITAMSQSGEDLIDFLQNNQIDIIFTEINFRGFDPENYLEEIKKNSDKTKIVVLSAYGDTNLVKSCFKAGADGYILKNSKPEILLDCIKSVVQGNIFIGENLKVSPEFNGNVRGKDQEELKKKRIPIDRFVLRQSITRREIEILELICSGNSNKKISELLFISEHTASVHRKHILKKLGVVNSQELIEFVAEFDILK